MVILTSDMELQDSQEERSKDLVEEGIKVQEKRPQYQIIQMNESSE